jgi:hypothetical protein
LGFIDSKHINHLAIASDIKARKAEKRKEEKETG